jgi:parvulin-like peptidyl-prolyl isomerase
MTISRLLLLPALLVALFAAGCGGGSEDVPKDAVAVVDGNEIAKSDYDALLAQAKKSYTNQKREFPKAGSQEFQTLKNQAVQFLVQREQFEQQAKDLDIEVTDKQVADRLEQIKKQYFGGDEKKYKTQLKQQGLSDTQVKADIRAQIVNEAIFAKVTKDVKVTDADVQAYYDKNKAQYSQPESREVRHILVKTRAEANKIYDELKAGGDFAALAKKYSTDTGSKANGGKLTITKGQTVAPFDQTAFLLETNVISRPVKTEFGYHIIQPVGPIVDAKVTPVKEVRDSIRQQLLQTKKNEKMTKWVDDLKKDYEDKVSYAVGFSPPPAATTTASTATTG